MIEIEIKARIDDCKKVERQLLEMGGIPIGFEKHADTYYNSPDRDFALTDEALRIRVNNGSTFLTYKGPKLDSISKTRMEKEMAIPDANVMGEILVSLGFNPVATIVKKRRKVRMNEFLVCLDEVRDLGSFIEVELTSENEYNIQEKVENAFEILAKIGIGKESTIRESYLEMFLKKGDFLKGRGQG